MLDRIKYNSLDIILSSHNYFIPICFNEDWDNLYAIDKYRLTEALERCEWDIKCEKIFVNEDVYSVIITSKNEFIKNDFIVSFDEKEKAKSIQIYVTRQELLEFGKKVFTNSNNDDFWKNI